MMMTRTFSSLGVLALVFALGFASLAQADDDQFQPPQQQQQQPRQRMRATPPPRPAPTYEFGVLAGVGLNMPSLGSNYSVTSSARAGVSAGAFLGWYITPQFSLEANMLWAYQASSQTNSANQLTISTTVSKNVLEVPIFARYWFDPHFGIGVGPYGAFGLGNYTVNGVSESYANYTKNQSEFGVAGSVQARYPLGPEAKLLLDVRYLLGLTDLNNDGVSSDSVYDRQLEFLAGIAFSL